MTGDPLLVVVMTAGAVVLTVERPLPVVVSIADVPCCSDAVVLVAVCPVMGTVGVAMVAFGSWQLGTSSAR